MESATQQHLVGSKPDSISTSDSTSSDDPLKDSRTPTPKISLRAATGEDPDLAASTLAAELESLDPTPYSVPRAVICGTSLGSYISLAHAFLHPESVAGLVLMNGGLNPTYPLAFPYLAFTSLMSTWSDTGPIRKLYDKGIEGYLNKGRTKEEVDGVLEGGSFFKGGGEAVGKGVLGWDYVAMAGAFVDKVGFKTEVYRRGGSSFDLPPQTKPTTPSSTPRRIRILILNADSDSLFLLHESSYIRAFTSPHILLSVSRIPDSGHLSFLDNPGFVGQKIASFARRCGEEEKAGETIERSWDGEELRDVGGVEGWKKRLASRGKAELDSVADAGLEMDEKAVRASLSEAEGERSAVGGAKEVSPLSRIRGWLGLGERGAVASGSG
jgi:pimeloyl-ACP methyl ester carboxylesterase